MSDLFEVLKQKQQAYADAYGAWKAALVAFDKDPVVVAAKAVVNEARTRHRLDELRTAEWHAEMAVDAAKGEITKVVEQIAPRDNT